MEDAPLGAQPPDGDGVRNRYDSAVLAIRQDGIVLPVRDAVLIVVPLGSEDPRVFELETLLRDELSMFDDRRADEDPDPLEDGSTIGLGAAVADDAAAARVRADGRLRGAFRTPEEFDAGVAERRSIMRRIELLQDARRGADEARRTQIAAELTDLEAEASVLRGRFRAFDTFRASHGGKAPWSGGADDAEEFGMLATLPRSAVRERLSEALTRVQSASRAGRQAERSRALREVSALQRRLREIDGVDDPRVSLDRRYVEALRVRYDWLFDEIHERVMADVPEGGEAAIKAAARRAFVEMARCVAGLSPAAVEKLLNGGDSAAA